MKKSFLLSLVFLFAFSGIILSQGKERGRDIPVLKEISGFQEVKSIISQATEIVQINDVWHKILDNKKEIVGYCMSSKPYSNDIKGYHGSTPVMIILDKNKKIKRVSMLSHYETQSYIDMLRYQNFFKSWEGLTIREAMNAKAPADSYSGATITAVAIRRNIDILLRKAYENRI